MPTTVAKELHANENTVVFHETICSENMGGLVKVRNVEKYGLAKLTGELICPCIYDEIETIKNSFKVKLGNLWGVMDANGKVICPCKYSNLIQIDDGGAYCEMDDDVYYIRFKQ